MTPTHVLLLLIVASLRISSSGQRDFRVLTTASRLHARSSASDTWAFCTGCLSPLQHHKYDDRKNKHAGSRGPYIYSRYWGVVSDRSLVAHFAALAAWPIIESTRALLVFLLLSLATPLAERFAWQALLLPSILTCDLLARQLCLHVKSGVLVGLMSASSVVLDMFFVVAVHASHARLFPHANHFFQWLSTAELGSQLVSVVAICCGFLENRKRWHPIYREASRLDHDLAIALFFCYCGREALAWGLHALPFVSGKAAVDLRLLCYCLTPLCTVACGLDLVRAIAASLHLMRRCTGKDVQVDRRHRTKTH